MPEWKNEIYVILKNESKFLFSFFKIHKFNFFIPRIKINLYLYFSKKIKSKKNSINFSALKIEIYVNLKNENKNLFIFPEWKNEIYVILKNENTNLVSFFKIT